MLIKVSNLTIFTGDEISLSLETVIVKVLNNAVNLCQTYRHKAILEIAPLLTKEIIAIFITFTIVTVVREGIIAIIVNRIS